MRRRASASQRTIKLASRLCGVFACALPFAAQAGTVANPICPNETAFFSPNAKISINVPDGFRVSMFAAGLNFPTGLAFLRKGRGFEVYVLESGHGLPSRCNEQGAAAVGGEFSQNNPFTPDILVFDDKGRFLRKLAKPSAVGVGFQTAGPAVDIAFENGFDGGRLFATDSDQATHAAGQNNSSRIVTVDPMSGRVTPFITNLPTGDHPTEQLAFNGGWIFWSQGSTTNSGVVGRDNGGGTNQPDIPCQDIVLSDNVFDSGGGTMTSGYSTFGTQRPGARVQAFEGASHRGVCDGAILAARLDAQNPASTIRPFSWGYRNGYAIRFAPEDHPLKGGLLVGEDGPDERGARPSNNAPDAFHLAQVNPDGTPDYHGWPDRFGFLASTQAVYNPIGGPSDDLCVPDPTNKPSGCTAASLTTLLTEDVPIRNVLAFPPQQITAPLAIEAADSSFTGIDFVPDSFVHGPVQRGAALYALEGDFGFSPPNSRAVVPASDPFAHEVGHEIKLLNFAAADGPVALKMMEFARNAAGDQAFITDKVNAFNRPTNIRFGPDGCAWVADYGAVRDPGADTHFQDPKDAPLVQIPGTGVIWRICPR
jgi:glucose/arabinose dehydrogenase